MVEHVYQEAATEGLSAAAEKSPDNSNQVADLVDSGDPNDGRLPDAVEHPLTLKIRRSSRVASNS